MAKDAERFARQVSAALKRDYEQHLDISDIETLSERERTPRVRSRAMSALAVRAVTGFSPDNAAASVIDGANDQGIDAIAITTNPAHVYLVQSKWSDLGTAKLDRGAARDMVVGLDLIDQELFDRFNARGQQLAEEASRMMFEEMAPTTLVVALMGTDKPGPGATQMFDDALLKYNRDSSFLDVRYLHAEDLAQQVRADLAPAPLNLTVEMERWHKHDGVHESFQGVVHVEDVAAWYQNHGSQLFHLNIRNPLGSTRTNAGIVKTLLNSPANFWYFNNGITLLCDTIQPHYRSQSAPQGSPVNLQAINSSIVNGAQTVTAIAEAMKLNPSVAANAYVSVRVIATQGVESFARSVTEATNLQNRVESRDFVALDLVQSLIRDELAAELDKEYTVKRGAPDPAPESGCSITEAAAALACFHPDAIYVSRLTKSPELLWERGSLGTYDVLFRTRPSAHQIWRSVITVRAVREALHETRSTREGRAAAVAQHGAYVIAYLVMQLLGREDIEEPGFDWENEVLAQVPQMTDSVLSWLMYHIDADGESRQIGRTLSDESQMSKLSRLVLRDARSARTAPPLPDVYVKEPKPRKPRRQNTVPYLVNEGALAEGTRLVYDAPGAMEREDEELTAWFAEDPRRRQATWTNDRRRPILWAADKRQYAPSGLVSEMWRLADWKKQPVANQGTKWWRVEGGETLWELALRLQAEKSYENE
jgi:hypothetical protein